MRSPYRYSVVTSDQGNRGLELAAASGIGLLADAERQGHINAAEWIEADLCDDLYLDIFDGTGRRVRTFHVYQRGPGRRLANTIVRERLS